MISSLFEHTIGPRWRSWRSPDFWIVVTLVCALAVRLYYLVRPVEWLIAMFSADDFFYYTNTAWNIAAGYGSSCDYGLTHHNGFHPLFLVTLLVPAVAGVGKIGIVYAGFLVLAVATLASLVIAYRVGRELGATWTALCVPIAIAGNVYFIRASFHGFETMLVLAMVLATMLACLRQRPAWEIGLWLGLACLARIDTVVLAGPVVLYMFLNRRTRSVPGVLVTALVVLAPWLLWSLTNFGSALPLSGAAKMHGIELRGLWTGTQVAMRAATQFIAGTGIRDHASAGVIAGIGTLIWLSAAGAALRDFRRALWIVANAVLAIAVYSTLTNPNYEGQLVRYLVPSAVPLVLLALARVPRIGVALPVIVLVTLVATESRFVRWAHRTPVLGNFVSLGQTEVPEVLDRVVGEDDLVGCFDSGSIGYFADRPVVNLDGLVNQEVADMNSRTAGGTAAERYVRYFHEKGITVLIGGTAFYWPRIFPDLATWEQLAPPISTPQLAGEVVFLRVPDLPAPGAVEQADE